MPAKIEIQVGADVNGVLSAMSKASKSLADFKAQAGRFKAMLSTATDPASIIRLNQAIEATNNRMKAIQSAGLNAGAGLQSLQKDSNSAGIALNNLGRIAQDAPFGFMGISNNLNPLLESFQRLKDESGSTGEALEALGSSLLGAGGIGIAVSVISSLLVVFGDRLFKTSKEADESAESFERLQKVIKETGESMSERSKLSAASADEEITKVNALAAVIKNQNLSYEQRNNALKQLQEINKNYFGDLTLETASLATLTLKVNEYADALISAAVVKSFSEDIGKLSVEFAKQLNTLNKLNKELDNNRNTLSNTDQFRSYLGGQKTINIQYVEAERAVKKSSEAVKQQSDVIVDLSGKLKDLKSDYQKAIVESLKFKPLGDDDGSKAKKDIETIQDVFSKLNDELIVLTKNEEAFGVSLNAERINKFKSAITELFSKFKLSPEDIVKFKLDDFKVSVSDLIIKAQNLTASHQIQELIKKDIAQPGSEGSGLQITVPVQVKAHIDTNTLSKNLDEGKVDISNALSDFMRNVASDFAVGLGEALGEAISGGNIGDVFKGIAAEIGSGLKQLGKQLIQVGLEMTIVKKAIEALKVNPYLAIAAGIALTALGTALQNSVKNSKQKFARGGLVPGVGNSDSVDALLTPGEFVMKKSAVQNIGRANLSLLNNGLMPVSAVSPGMQTIQIVGEEMISGENIYIAYKRYEARRGRNT